MLVESAQVNNKINVLIISCFFGILISFIYQVNGHDIRKEIKRHSCPTYEKGNTIEFISKSGFPFTFYEEHAKLTYFSFSDCRDFIQNKLRPISFNQVNSSLLILDILITAIPATILTFFLYRIASEQIKWGWAISSVILSVLMTFNRIIMTALAGSRPYYENLVNMYHLSNMPGISEIFVWIGPLLFYTIVIYVCFWIIRKCITGITKVILRSFKK